MRAFHVDGLTAVWVRCSIHGSSSSPVDAAPTPSPALTGGRHDKRSGRSAAQRIADASSQCVRHAAGLDGKLFPPRRGITR